MHLPLTIARVAAISGHCGLRAVPPATENGLRLRYPLYQRRAFLGLLDFFLSKDSVFVFSAKTFRLAECIVHNSMRSVCSFIPNLEPVIPNSNKFLSPEVNIRSLLVTKKAAKVV